MNLIEKSECIECPNENHCTKDDTKCCYLVKNQCILKREALKE